jgi:beta-N-acetylhexosaminidase
VNELRRLALSVVLPGFTGTEVPAWVGRLLEAGMAGVCLFGQNIETTDQVRTLTRDLHATRPGVLVTSDEEGGTVTRLEVRNGSSWPGHGTLGALDDVQATYDVAACVGALARWHGIDVVLAPVVDVNSEPDNPVIGVRSFGAGPDLVARHGAAFVGGLQASGVAACAKHYPGHGATRVDSHLDLPVLDVDAATLRDRDLPPFGAAVKAGVRCVMTGHLVVRALDPLPATYSAPLLRILREELGFEGVVISDALDMRAVSARVGLAAGGVQALAAGVDLLCVGNPVFPDGYDEEAAALELVDAIEEAVRDGRLSEARLQEASARVADLAAWAQPTADAPPPDPRAALELGTKIARRALRTSGDVTVAGDAVVLVPRTPVGIAAGRGQTWLQAVLRQRRPSWEVVERYDVGAIGRLLGGRGNRDLLLVVDGRPDRATDDAVRTVLAHDPDAVLVHAGPAGTAPPAERSVLTFGGGRAVAEAVADLLLGERDTA